MGLPENPDEPKPGAGYTVNDRRGQRAPEEACRVCGCPEVHTQDYNAPTMKCIEYLRALASKAEALRLAADPATVELPLLTEEQINTMDLEEACAQIGNRVYKVCLLYEQLEHRGVLSGNGHHAAQHVADMATQEMRARWKTVSPEKTK